MATQTNTHASHEAEQICNDCAKHKAVYDLLTARHGKSKKKLQAAVQYFGQVFNLCSCHALQRFDEAAKIRNGGTEQDRVNEIVAALNEMSVRDDASEACNRLYAEGWADDEGKDGAARAIARSIEADVRLANHFKLTPERVKEIVAAADAAHGLHNDAIIQAQIEKYLTPVGLTPQRAGEIIAAQKKSDADIAALPPGGYHTFVLPGSRSQLEAAQQYFNDQDGSLEYEDLLDDILLRLKNNDADCDPEGKASSLEWIAQMEREYLQAMGS